MNVIGDKVLADMVGLRQPARFGLNGVLQIQPEIGAVPQQFLEGRAIPRCRDDKNLPNARKHEDRKRIVNLRFVVNGNQLLADRFGRRIKTRSGPSRENNAPSHAIFLLAPRPVQFRR